MGERDERPWRRGGQLPRRMHDAGAGVVVVGSLRRRGGGKGRAAVAARWSTPLRIRTPAGLVMKIEEFSI